MVKPIHNQGQSYELRDFFESNLPLMLCRLPVLSVIADLSMSGLILTYNHSFAPFRRLHNFCIVRTHPAQPILFSNATKKVQQVNLSPARQHLSVVILCRSNIILSSLVPHCTESRKPGTSSSTPLDELLQVILPLSLPLRPDLLRKLSHLSPHRLSFLPSDSGERLFYLLPQGFGSSLDDDVWPVADRTTDGMAGSMLKEFVADP